MNVAEPEPEMTEDALSMESFSRIWPNNFTLAFPVALCKPNELDHEKGDATNWPRRLEFSSL